MDLDGTTISRRVTLRHLLTHTSGIADDADEEAGESHEALWRDRPSYAVTETADFLPQFAHKEPVFPPGEGCRYCNCGYVLAGLALERVTGERRGGSRAVTAAGDGTFTATRRSARPTEAPTAQPEAS